MKNLTTARQGGQHDFIETKRYDFMTAPPNRLSNTIRQRGHHVKAALLPGGATPQIEKIKISKTCAAKYSEDGIRTELAAQNLARTSGEI